MKINIFYKFSEPLTIINGRKVQWFSFTAEFLPNSAPNNQRKSLAEVRRKQCAVTCTPEWADVHLLCPQILFRQSPEGHLIIQPSSNQLDCSVLLFKTYIH